MRIPRVHPLGLLVPALLVLASAPAAQAATDTAPYDMPGSIVVRGVFGFGVLACASGLPTAIADNVRNGACFDYDGDQGRFFAMGATDFWWADTSVTIAVDVNGDGCVSESCNGVPNSANDYRLANCGTVFGILPSVEPTADPVVQVFLRGLDVTEDLQVCGATNGEVHFTRF